ncbi:MAG: RecQ family ATP-dependent DNA helicase, partial [Myxococcota bacterium]
LDRDAYEARRDAVARGEVELLYVAPERFTPAFVHWCKQRDIRTLAIDEAHCLSQWGHDFRPEYLKLGKVREALGKPTTMALTATATPEVQDDIVSTLGIGEGERFIQGFDRKNLVLEVIRTEKKSAKNPLLVDLVQPGPSLVYCATRKHVERACQTLREAGVRTGMYHAGMDAMDRTRMQDAFMAGQVPVVVATNAFGMGIDKRDIRTIVHYDMPGTVEAYYQEIGRAGRDGRQSRAVLLHAGGIDRRIHEFFIDNAHPPARWVHNLWQGLLGAGQNPVFGTLEHFARHLPAEAGDRAVAACLHILVREGRVRRIAPADRSAFVRITGEPSGAVRGHRQVVWDHIQAQRNLLGPSPILQFQPDGWCRELDLSRDQLTAALRGLEDRGLVAFQAADRMGGVELIEPSAPLTLDERRMEQRRNREYTKLDRMMAYVEADCRRRYVVEYFGEQAPFESCGTCDACRAGTRPSDAPMPPTPDQEQIVLKVLSCVARMERQRGQSGFSVDLVAKTLTGSKERKIVAFRFHELSTFGLLSSWTPTQVADVVKALVDAGALSESYVTRDIGGKRRTYKEVEVSELGWQVMRREADAFAMRFPHPEKLDRTLVAIKSAPSSDLVAMLRDLRRQLADEKNVPAYVVAPNETIEDMARLQPRTKNAMLAVHGMGPKRFSTYGRAFLEAIREWSPS